MKERLILFSGEMVRALLDGRKSQTRQIIRPQPLEPVCKLCTFHVRGREWLGLICGDPPRITQHCPYGVVGDRLWVRETWFDNYADRWDGSTRTHDEQGFPCIHYRADGIPDFEGEEGDMRWSPSIHMPRWASRITLEITGIRVERVNAISEADARAEGVKPILVSRGWEADGCIPGGVSHLEAFAALWDRLNPRCPFGSGPWVWVIEFRRVEVHQ